MDSLKGLGEKLQDTKLHDVKVSLHHQKYG